MYHQAPPSNNGLVATSARLLDRRPPEHSSCAHGLCERQAAGRQSLFVVRRRCSGHGSGLVGHGAQVDRGSLHSDVA